MKTSLSRAYLILLLLALVACGKKTETTSTSPDADEWPEMDSFHMIMAEVFHPYKDSSNVEPAKRMAEEMAQAAEGWQKTALPGKVDNDEMKAQLVELAIGTRAMADQIKAGSTDPEIGKSLTALHDRFHKIQEAWHGGGEKHSH